MIQLLSGQSPETEEESFFIHQGVSDSIIYLSSTVLLNICQTPYCGPCVSRPPCFRGTTIDPSLEPF